MTFQQMIGIENAYLARYLFLSTELNMRISIKSLAVLATGIVVLGACQHTTMGSSNTTADSNMAALEASRHNQLLI